MSDPQMRQDTADHARRVTGHVAARRASLAAMLDRFAAEEMPREVLVELTNACNLACTICGRGQGGKRIGFMDPALFRKIIDEVAAKSPTATVWLHKDGESFLHRQFLPLLHYATGLLRTVHVSTNGTRLPDDATIEQVLSTRLKYLRFSLDGLTTEEFERIRLGCKYADLVRTIERTVAIRDRMGSGVEIGVRATAFGALGDDPSAFVDRWEGVVDRVELVPLASWPGVIEVSNRGVEDRLPCSLLFHQFTINWDGTVAPCCFFVRPPGERNSGLLGDVRDQSIQEIWRGASYRRLREAHLKSAYGDARFCLSCRNNIEPCGQLVKLGGFVDRLAERLNPSPPC